MFGAWFWELSCGFRASFVIRSFSFVTQPRMINRHRSHRTCHRSKQTLSFGNSEDSGFPQQNLFPESHRLWERSVPPLGRDCLARCRPAIRNPCCSPTSMELCGRSRFGGAGLNCRNQRETKARSRMAAAGVRSRVPARRQFRLVASATASATIREFTWTGCRTANGSGTCGLYGGHR